MNWLLGILALISIVGIGYITRYYMLVLSMKNACRQMKEIGQNPEDNRILLVAHANHYLDSFLKEFNEYIQSSQKMRIQYSGRENKFRRQIEAMSHDLRTPLTAILGYLELLDGNGMEAEDRESLEVVQGKAKKLQGLISNFYDLSRLELNDYRFDLVPLDLSRFVKEEMLQSYRAFEQRNLQVEMYCEDAVCVRADVSAMERIVSNMIQNVLRYASSCLKVHVKTVEDGLACLIFENDANTLEDEDIPHLFERFYMSDAARSGQGTGLGLTISKLLVEAMGGRAEARFNEKILEIRYYFIRTKDL